MTQYIDKNALVAEIEKRERRLDIDSPYGIGAMVELECLKDIINTLEVKDVDIEHYELEEFAKIVRGNLTGINKTVQTLFEAKYQQLTGNKMYGGYKD